MTQSFSLIFWKKQMKNSDTLFLAKIVCEILGRLISYHSELYPQYITATTKNKAKKLMLCEEEICNLLDQGLKREWKYSVNLGTTLAFFTSLVDERSAKISFSIGYDSPMLENSIVIDLPASMNEFIYKNTSRFYVLFQEIVEIFRPYYAFVANSLNNHISDRYWGDKPCYVHWMNYFSNETVELIGARKFSDLNCITTVDRGVFLRLQNDLFDVTDVNALEHQVSVTRILEL